MRIKFNATMRLLIRAVLLLLGSVSSVGGCRIDSQLHGTFKRQNGQMSALDADSPSLLVYDEITISPTSISDYGDCYLQYGTSYVLGLKFASSFCRNEYSILEYLNDTKEDGTTNLFPMRDAHFALIKYDVCHATEHAAKTSCFDPNLVSLSDGALLFRSQNVEPVSCGGIDGRFTVGYTMRDSKLSCDAAHGTSAENCDVASRLFVRFRNCTFPDFDMSLRCIGSWTDRGGVRYIVMENEENEEYRCGLVIKDGGTIVHFANDSACSRLTVSNAFETYRFSPEFSGKPFSPCPFPQWIRGEFDSLSVSANELQYFQTGAGAVPIVSHCVQTFDDRVLVYSETKCGEPLGYHCLWFNARSQNVIEFKTTAPQESANHSLCLDDKQWDEKPWTTSVIRKADGYPCGVFGAYTTPSELRSANCYNVSFDCTDPTAMRIVAFSCDNGIVLDSRSYKCLASWKDGTHLFMFTERSEVHNCFVTQYHKGRLYLASTGIQCERDYNFSEHQDTTIVVEEEASCAKQAKIAKSRKSHKAKAHASPSHTSTIVTSTASSTNTTTPVEDTSDSQQWQSEATPNSIMSRLFFSVLLLYPITAMLIP